MTTTSVAAARARARPWRGRVVALSACRRDDVGRVAQVDGRTQPRAMDSAAAATAHRRAKRSSSDRSSPSRLPRTLGPTCQAHTSYRWLDAVHGSMYHRLRQLGFLALWTRSTPLLASTVVRYRTGGSQSPQSATTPRELNPRKPNQITRTASSSFASSGIIPFCYPLTHSLLSPRSSQSFAPFHRS